MIAQVSRINAGEKGSRPGRSFSFYSLLTAGLILAAVVFFSIVIRNVFAGEKVVSGSCVECHSDIVADNMSKAYVHMPFMEQQCPVCHLDGGLSFEGKAGGSVGEQQEIDEKNIRWIDFSASPALENWFFIPAEKAGPGRLVVSARSNGRQKFLEIFELPAIETLPVKAAETGPPVIESVKVRGVYRGLLVSARIGWSTDKLADAEVLYGIDGLRYSVQDAELTTDHEIVLEGLKVGREYQYMAISTDMFGNSAVSDSGSFSTANPLPVPQEKYEEPRETEIRLAVEFFRNENSYLVRFTANQPVILKVGSVVVKSFQADGSSVKMINASYTFPAASPTHMPMRNLDNISEVCRKCHDGMFKSGNHVVNRGPSPGMVIPADYFTSSAGHITCLTCHNPHASDFKYITVKSSEGELCIGCHKGYDLAPEKRRQTMPLLMARQ